MALVAMLVFAVLADQIYNQEAFVLDTVANPFLHAISSPALDVVMNGDHDARVGPVRRRPVRSAPWSFFVYHGDTARGALPRRQRSAAASLLDGLLKIFVHRPRPALPWAHVLPDYSFPSGHSMNSLVFYLAIALIVRTIYGPRAGSIAVPLALLIAIAVGLSRIYLGYHYLSDVVGGFAAGLAWLFIVADRLRGDPADLGEAAMGAPPGASTAETGRRRRDGPARLLSRPGAPLLAVARDPAGARPPRPAVVGRGRRGAPDRGRRPRRT